MDATQIILIVFIALLIIIYPILISTRNKKENQRMQEQTNSLKRGDKVLTTSGVYGTIVDLQLDDDKKIVTIETGTEKNKGYISVDAYAIYTIFKEEDTANEAEKSTQSKHEDKNDKEALNVNDKTAENSIINENGNNDKNKIDNTKKEDKKDK